MQCVRSALYWSADRLLCVVVESSKGSHQTVPAEEDDDEDDATCRGALTFDCWSLVIEERER